MKNVFVLILMCLCIAGYAQAGYEDVVYLKNGSIIHGVIIEQVPNVSIKIKNKVGDVLFYKYEEIEKLTKEESPKETTATATPAVKKADTVDHFKIMANLDISGLLGLAGTAHIPYALYGNTLRFASTPASAFQIALTISRRVRPRLYVGGGLGFGLSPHRIIGAMTFAPGVVAPNYSILVPGYADVRYLILKGKHTPYVAGQGGAAFYAGGGKTGGGALLGLQFGGRFSVSNKVGLYIFAGYRMQHIAVQDVIQYTDQSGNNTIEVRVHQNYVFHFFTLGGGISF